jgi:SAM-dependent MidA family methyltransferase
MKEALIQRIASNGPMHFDTYMDACLYDPDHGFYSAGRVRPGDRSDFVTSPEVSPSFGAFIASWAARNDPSGNAMFVEFGAGSGALLREVAPSWLDNGREVYAVEVSSASRAAIAAEFPDVSVVGSFNALPVGRDAVVVANEVLDNLPAALARRSAGSWVEIAVDSNGVDLVLAEVPARKDVVDWCESVFADAQDGVVVSVQLAAGWLIEGILKRFGRCAVCIIDYGSSSLELMGRNVEQVVRTYRSHTKGYDLLATPGAMDITVDVNLTAVERVARRSGATVERLTQRDFLITLGASERIRDAIERERHQAAAGDVMNQLTARSERVGMEALLDSDGLGGFEVVLIHSGT